MPASITPAPGIATPAYPACVEHGVWNPIPVDPPNGQHNLKFKDVDPDEAHAIRQRGVQAFMRSGVPAISRSTFQVRWSRKR